MKNNWKNVLYMSLFVLGMLLVIYFLIAKPENDAIALEKQRLIKVENEIMNAIANKDTVKVKIYIIQLRWQYESGTTAGRTETEGLRKTWNNKRKEYLKLIGENPKDFIYDIND